MKEKIWMVALLVITALVSAGMLAVINIKTQPIVQKNNEIKLKKCVLDVFNVPYTNENVEPVFGENVDILDKNGTVYYQMKSSQTGKDSSGNGSVIAFKVGGPGFWGQISALLAVQGDRETIEGIKFLKHEETPGLGGRIDEEWFWSQFKGKKLKPKLVKAPYKMAKTQNEFDAITGATQTSKSVEVLINKSVKSFYTKLDAE